VLQVLVVVAAAFEFESRDDVPQVLNPIGAYERIGLCAISVKSYFFSIGVDCIDFADCDGDEI